MADVIFKGLEEGSDFDRWVDEITDPSVFEDILEDIGKQSVTLSTEKITKNLVVPKTSDATLEARRTRKKQPSTSGVTLLDTGVGVKQIAYENDAESMAVGVPDGHMAYHQEGRVPNSPKREFLELLEPDKRIEVAEFHWEEVTRKYE